MVDPSEPEHIDTCHVPAGTPRTPPHSQKSAEARSPTTGSLEKIIEAANVPSYQRNDKSVTQSILEHVTTAIILVDATLAIRYVNPAGENLLACSKTRLLGESCLPLFEGEPYFVDQLQTALATQHPFTHRDLSLYMPGRSTPTLDCTVNPMVWQDGTATLLIELAEKDRLSRISRDQALLSTHNATRLLLKGVAHEVKNPLGGILGAAQLMKRELPSDHLEEYLDVIIQETDRLRNLVDRMLGPRDLPVFKLTNLHEILEHVLHILRAEGIGNVTIYRDYDVSLPDITVDRDRLIQAFLNILRNAVQALLEQQDNTRPTINIQTRILRQFTLSGKRHRLALCIKITDNGPGIPESLMESIFLPMVTSRAEGNGLGLSIAQDIMNQHAGLIECDSKPGNTTFTIILPLENDLA
jgi:two-component system nitrogen regulation sensor histidine kinase GlnL